jgi:hypothetical protein
MFKRRRINQGADYAVNTDNSDSMAPLLGAMEQFMGYMQAAVQTLMESNARIETKLQALDAQIAKHSNIVAKMTKEIEDLQIHALHGAMMTANHDEPAPYIHF